MSQSVQESAPGKELSAYKPGEPVALFIPCYIDQFYPSIGKACVKLLEKFGVPMTYPDKQTCCGQPAFNSGYWDEARPVIQHFCKTFADQKWIVCPSASCTAMARVFFGHVDPSDDVVNVGNRVFELTEFLVDVLKITDTGATFPHKVTMHSGCHGRRELGIVEQPLALLKNVRGLTYELLPNIEECCGFGGTFSVKMPGTSLAMGKTKVDNIVKTGADYVVSVDISCLMHVGGIMQRTPEAKHIKPIHIAEVLASGWE